ncbi:hypothetical protein U1Q18_032192 [Sarracenia purpurea var. burkii]
MSLSGISSNSNSALPIFPNPAHTEIIAIHDTAFSSDISSNNDLAISRSEQKHEYESKNNQPDHGRGYSDDEPLLSPIDGGRCVPIPEVEDEDGEVEEFQGFANPLSSSSDESAFNYGDSKNVEVSLMPEAAVVTVRRSHHAYTVVLRAKAPLPPSPPRQPAHSNNSAHFLNPSRRAPIDLLTVLHQCYVRQIPLHCYANVGNSQNALGVNYGVTVFTSTSLQHYLNFIL